MEEFFESVAPARGRDAQQLNRRRLSLVRGGKREHLPEASGEEAVRVHCRAACHQSLGECATHAEDQRGIRMQHERDNLRLRQGETQWRFGLGFGFGFGFGLGFGLGFGCGFGCGLGCALGCELGCGLGLGLGQWGS